MTEMKLKVDRKVVEEEDTRDSNTLPIFKVTGRWGKRDRSVEAEEAGQLRRVSKLRQRGSGSGLYHQRVPYGWTGKGLRAGQQSNK